MCLFVVLIRASVCLPLFSIIGSSFSSNIFSKSIDELHKCRQFEEMSADNCRISTQLRTSAPISGDFDGFVTNEVSTPVLVYQCYFQFFSTHSRSVRAKKKELSAIIASRSFKVVYQSYFQISQLILKASARKKS